MVCGDGEDEDEEKWSMASSSKTHLSSTSTTNDFWYVCVYKYIYYTSKMFIVIIIFNCGFVCSFVLKY